MRPIRLLLSVLVAGVLTGCQNGADDRPPRAAATPLVRPVVSAEESAT